MILYKEVGIMKRLILGLVIGMLIGSAATAVAASARAANMKMRMTTPKM